MANLAVTAPVRRMDGLGEVAGDRRLGQGGDALAGDWFSCEGERGCGREERKSEGKKDRDCPF